MSHHLGIQLEPNLHHLAILSNQGSVHQWDVYQFSQLAFLLAIIFLLLQKQKNGSVRSEL